MGVTNAAGQTLAFGPGGTLILTTRALQPAIRFSPAAATACGSLTVSNLLSPTERINLDTLMHFQINDHINAFGEGYFSETHATNLLSQPAYNAAIFGQGGTANGNFVVSLNNPYPDAGDRALIQTALNNYAATLPLGACCIGGVTAGPEPAGHRIRHGTISQFYVSRANTRSARRPGDGHSNVWFAASPDLNGDFTLGSRNFNWEVAVSYGSSSNTQVTPSYVFQNLTNALNATTNAAGPDRLRRHTGQRADSNGFEHLRTAEYLRQRYSPSLAALQYITHLATVESFNTQRDVNAFIIRRHPQAAGGRVEILRRL